MSPDACYSTHLAQLGRGPNMTGGRLMNPNEALTRSVSGDPPNFPARGERVRATPWPTVAVAAGGFNQAWSGFSIRPSRRARARRVAVE